MVRQLSTPDQRSGRGIVFVIAMTFITVLILSAVHGWSPASADTYTILILGTFFGIVPSAILVALSFAFGRIIGGKAHYVPALIGTAPTILVYWVHLSEIRYGLRFGAYENAIMSGGLAWSVAWLIATSIHRLTPIAEHADDESGAGR